MDVGSFPKRLDREGMPRPSLQGCIYAVSNYEAIIAHDTPKNST